MSSVAPLLVDQTAPPSAQHCKPWSKEPRFDKKTNWTWCAYFCFQIGFLILGGLVVFEFFGWGSQGNQITKWHWTPRHPDRNGTIQGCTGKGGWHWSQITVEGHQTPSVEKRGFFLGNHFGCLKLKFFAMPCCELCFLWKHSFRFTYSLLGGSGQWFIWVEMKDDWTILHKLPAVWEVGIWLDISCSQLW